MGNHSDAVDGVGTQLVRDVFVAANLVHEDSMSRMGGSIHDDDESGGNIEAVADDYRSSFTNCSMGVGSSEEDGKEGGPMVKCMPCTAI